MDKLKAGGSSRQVLIRYRNAVLLGCTALVALSPLSVRAQDAASQAGGTVLETITVDGTGTAGDNDSKSIVASSTTGAGKMATDILDTPASVSVITSKEVQERGADSIEQVVQYTSGVVTDFYGSDDRYDYFKIRGFYPFTYRDGLMLGRSWGGVLEEPYAFERIEVLKGASSTGFGVSDPGGAVNYVTKTPKSGRFGEVYATGGSFDHKETGFDFGDNITEDDTLSYRLTGKVQRSEGEYDYSQDDENFIMGGLTWRPSDATSLSFVFDHLDKDGTPSNGGHPLGTDLDRDSFFGDPDYNYLTANRNTYSLLFDHDFGSGLTMNASARYSKSSSGFGYAYLSGLDTASGPTYASRYYFGDDSADEDLVVDAHLQYDTSFDLVDSQTLVGVEFGKHESDTKNYWEVAPSVDWTNPGSSGGPVYATGPYSSTISDQNTKALYLQQNLTFNDRLTATVGLRNDWLDLEETNRIAGTTASADYSELTKRLGLSYKLTSELATYVSYAESIAPPSTGTEPTTGKQYEVGIKYKPDAFPALFTASVYDLTMQNITTYDAPTYLPMTVDKIRHRGLDLEAKAEVTDNVELIAAYSYIDSKIIEPGGTYDGNSFSQVPEHMASIWGNYTLKGNGTRGDMTFGLGARYIGPYYFNNENTQKSDGAVVFDAAFTYAIKENTTFQVNASNLFDEKHLAHSDGGALFYNPGRAIYATLRQTW
ncbi:TonB-dependent siderophore receptor [Agrobacterium sp. a22-2]|uniref:TonB-dependent siderophore receptor n=1 Tax=Agrobacterium sp. a22-2 TaxID=2283840 RepID=UPI001448A08A|nr:TonB-dependent siderophore receptor [Agrobacterium sp. a22-2]NKN35959.1 TonB-dependent siderophore receptor [Agrobacterium sp. a22-2]